MTQSRRYSTAVFALASTALFPDPISSKSSHLRRVRPRRHARDLINRLNLKDDAAAAAIAESYVEVVPSAIAESTFAVDANPVESYPAKVVESSYVANTPPKPPITIAALDAEIEHSLHSFVVNSFNSPNPNAPCMEQASGIDLGCTAQDIKFDRVTGFDILDGPNLLACNCSSLITTPACATEYDIDCGLEYELGTVFGACNGGNGNDEVVVQMNVDFLVSTTRYDIGMYIATDGGSAVDGQQCDVSTLQYGTYGDVQVWEVEGDTTSPNPAPDNCFDLGTTGTLRDYPFAPVTLSCTDSNEDGLLDFDIGIVWSVKKGDYDCDIDDAEKRPVASSSPKCWYDENFRATIPIYVPPESATESPTPSPTPPPNNYPNTADCRDDVNICFALDMSGSVCNGGQSLNCNECLQCQEPGLTKAQCCSNFEKVRQFAKDVTTDLNDMGIGTIGTSVVEFATGATRTSSLTTNMTETLVALDGMVFTGGWTDHADALTVCHATFNDATSEIDGEGKKNIIVLVTDGRATMPQQNPELVAKNAATVAKDDGVVILPVFISDQNSASADAYMSALSSDGNVYDVGDFGELNGVIESLVDQVLCISARARDDYVETPMGVQVQIDMLLNDSGNGTLHVENIVVDRDPQHGQVYVVGDPWTSVNYMPDPEFVGTDTFEYEMCDSLDECDTAVVTVEVLPLPAAIDDFATTTRNTPISIDVISNDIHDDTATITAVTQPVGDDVGTVTFPNTNVRYVPPNGFFGMETFTYTICQSSDNECDTATVTVDVIPASPDAIDDTAETPMQTPVTIPVLENDVSNVPLVVQNITEPPSNGVVYSGGTLGENAVYYPATGFQGNDTFKYLACNAWDQCDEAVVTVEVGPPAIVAINDYATTTHETPVTVIVLANDQGDELDVAEIPTGPENGAAEIQDDGNVTYTPDLLFFGNDTFTYKACEVADAELCDTATVIVEVPVPAILAVDDTASTSENTPVDIFVLTNDIGDDLTVEEIPTGPQNGVASIVDNKVVYTPNDNFDGVDTLTYRACNGDSECDTAIVTITVPDPPIEAEDDSTSTPKYTPVDIPVLDNDRGEDLTLKDFPDAPDHGEVTIFNNQAVYTPTDDYTGPDTFTYTACNGVSEVCDTATVTITVEEPAIEAINDTTSTPKRTPVTIPVLPNDNGENLSVEDTTNPSNGSVEIIDNQVVYTPNDDFDGQDIFTYEACTSEPVVECDTAIVIVTVEPPVIGAVDDTTSTRKDTPVDIPVLVNDIGDELTIDPNFPDQPNNGVVTIDDDVIVYTPSDDYVGPDTFIYRACLRDTEDCDTATVTVIVEPPAVVAIDDSTSTPKRTPATIAVLTNDIGDQLTVHQTIPDSPSYGTVSVQSNLVIYTPTGDYVGQDSFTYQACASTSECDTASVTVDVQNQPPVANPDIIQMTSEDRPTLIINVLVNDSDPNDDSIGVGEVTEPNNGFVVICADSQCVIYTANTDFSGEDTFEYVVCDTNNLCDTAVVTILVNPDAVDDIESGPEGEDITKDVLENDVGEDLVVEFVAPPSNGVCVITASGSIKYTPNGGFTGRDECFYTACTSGTAACDTAKLTVDVIAAPSYSPSQMPSEPPTEAWYYPDWINDAQVCKNDYAEPEYMLEVQRKNYLYRSKELCCQNHFWWRITQCMANEHPMYYSTGQKCDQKVFFEFHESKYTPADWSSSDLFETLEDCCTHKFGYNVRKCMADSPRELKLYFSLDIQHLNEPAFCQDADIIANALGIALERGLDDDMIANVTSIGCATITRNSDTGNPECGGCLAGDDFLGGTSGMTVLNDATGVVTPIQVEIRKKCYESKTEEDVIVLTDYVTNMLQGYIAGSLTQNIQSWSRERIPAVGQLFDSVADFSSFAVTNVVNPFAPKDAKYYPDWVQLKTCVKDGLEPPYMKESPDDYLFDTASSCCARYFAGESSCGSSSSTSL